MEYWKKNIESIIDTFNREGLEAGQLKLNSLYCDHFLERLKQRHRELTLLNQQLHQKMKAQQESPQSKS